MEDPIIDCLIIGGGPAGLTAAIYLARFHLDILVVDGGKSRASWIPCTRNHAGYPDGIEGKELLRRMREQACKYGAKIETEFVTKLEREGETGLFTATWGSGEAKARDCPTRDRRNQPPSPDGRRSPRRCARSRPRPLLSDLRRL